MNLLLRSLLFASVLNLCGCAKERAADFKRDVASPSGKVVARFAGYQPRGTIEGYLTVTFSSPSAKAKPQVTLGHMLRVRAGWLNDHTFAFIYNQLEQREFTSPVYSTGEVSSMVEVITCNRHYVDCESITGRLSPTHSILVQQFPEGTWPVHLNAR